jgi:5-methylcytosine-specific restriction protein A
MTRLRMLPPHVQTLDTSIAKPPGGQQRFGSRVRGYDRKWEEAAARFKAANPYCVGCMAMGTRMATEVVDHVDPHRGDRIKFWDVANWQASCTWHHSSVKATLEAMYERGELAADALRLDSAAAVSIARRLGGHGGLKAPEG